MNKNIDGESDGSFRECSNYINSFYGSLPRDCKNGGLELSETENKTENKTENETGIENNSLLSFL